MYKRYFKRIFDIIICLLGLPFFILIYIPVAILIKLEDGGPVFYSGQRIGENGVPFIMHKFRSMKVNAPDIRMSDGSTFNAKDDLRLTKVGKFLRESSIDEIPQLINIIVGQMSLIGPRPDLNSNDKYPDENKSFVNAKPGITGYNQAYFRNETNWFEKMKNDKYYVDHMSLGFDIKIFFRTIYIVLKREKMYKNKL